VFTTKTAPFFCVCPVFYLVHELVDVVIGLSLQEEQTMTVIENRALREMFELKRDEVTGEWRRLHKDPKILHFSTIQNTILKYYFPTIQNTTQP
jgi:hypothetical protein